MWLRTESLNFCLTNDSADKNLHLNAGNSLTLLKLEGRENCPRREKNLVMLLNYQHNLSSDFMTFLTFYSCESWCYSCRNAYLL